MMHISYESSDGYSGSEMEFDDSRSMNSTYSAGDVSISFDDDNVEVHY